MCGIRIGEVNVVCTVIVQNLVRNEEEMLAFCSLSLLMVERRSEVSEVWVESRGENLEEPDFRMSFEV